MENGIHLAFRGITTSSGSALLRVLRDTMWKRKGQTRKISPGVQGVYSPAY